MSITSSRSIQIQFSGDTIFELIQSALDNSVSPGESILTSLAIGNNTITAPVISGIVSKGLTIIPPSGNTAIITIKGVNGDTGFPLHLTDPTSIAIDPTFTSIVLSVTAIVTGLRLIWS